MSMTISNTHAAILTLPGMGHMIPALELAKRLVTHNIIPKVTFFYGSIKISTPSKAETQILQLAINENLFDIIQLPPLDLTNLVGPKASINTKVAALMHEIPPLFVSTISTMQLNPTMIIIDFFLSQVLPLLENLKVPKFVFVPTNAWVLALGLHTPTLDKETQGQYSNPISIPGCRPIHPNDLFAMLRDRTQRLYHEYVGACEGATLANGILVNTFHELEPKTIEALNSGVITKVPVYPIGPIVREKSPNGDHEGKRGDVVVEWLDMQEEESVVYVSLGSGFSMTFDQVKEMALGLELSDKKFVWSLHPPVNKAGIDNYLTAGEKTESTSNLFPEEFYRIQKNGIVITDWAAQLDILKHPSIGGFVSHCGWNSVIESVSCGVPIVGCPIYAEQNMNARMLTEEVGNAVFLQVSLSTNFAAKEELAQAIRKVMGKESEEGSVIRKRAKELKLIAESAWSQDGSSYFALSKISQTNQV